jgi:uncharacterized phage protein gp47/JayE
MASGFKMKTFNQVTASLVNWFASAQSSVTDLNVGSVARTILEAIASELAEVYYRIFTSIEEAQAEAVYRSFDFPRKSATASAGILLFQRATLALSDVTIPLGVVVAAPATSAEGEIAFTTNQTAILPTRTTLAAAITSGGQATVTVTSAANLAVGDVLLVDSERLKISGIAGNVLTVSRGYGGTTATTHSLGAFIGVVGKAVAVTAVVAGAAGNVSAASVVQLKTGVAGVESITNEAKFSGGADEETDDERKKRFQEFISALARGTKPAIEFGAKQIAGIVSAKAIDLDDDNAIPPGFVNLYVADASGTASGTLLAAVSTEENNWRAAGVKVTVAAPSIVTVNVTATLTLDPGFNRDTLVDQITQRLIDFISAKQMGEDVFLAYLYEVIVDTNPTAIINAQIATPAADVTISAAQIARPGTITLTVV